jgi:hypothetical protein
MMALNAHARTLFAAALLSAATQAHGQEGDFNDLSWLTASNSEFRVICELMAFREFCWMYTPQRETDPGGVRVQIHLGLRPGDGLLLMIEGASRAEARIDRGDPVEALCKARGGDLLTPNGCEFAGAGGASLMRQMRTGKRLRFAVDVALGRASLSYDLDEYRAALRVYERHQGRLWPNKGTPDPR